MLRVRHIEALPHRDAALPAGLNAGNRTCRRRMVRNEVYSMQVEQDGQTLLGDVSIARTAER